VLTGGGARAAYQVGALRALAELIPAKASPFQVIAGVSAGAINAVSIACGANDFRAATKHLFDMWGKLSPDCVYRTSALNLLGIGSRWLKDLAAGGILGSSRINYLLDTAPLRAMLAAKLPLSKLSLHFASGLLHGVAVSATSYADGLAVTFFDGSREIEPWRRSMRVGVRERLRLQHVLASSSIPIFFPPVKIGKLYYADGCVCMHNPLSPAIHLGADRILAIGVQTAKVPRIGNPPAIAHGDWLRPSEIAGVLMNALFLDALEADLERLERVNQTVSLLPADMRGTSAQPLRNIPVLALRPSQDLGSLAADQPVKFPRILRYLLKGIGAEGETGSDLLSYLAFEREYVGRLMQLGYEDTLKQRGAVEEFLEDQVLDTSGVA